MVEPNSENSTITAVMSSQPLVRSRWASAATATSNALVWKLTEMNAPIDMMKTMTPIWPNIVPSVSVSTNWESGSAARRYR